MNRNELSLSFWEEKGDNNHLIAHEDFERNEMKWYVGPVQDWNDLKDKTKKHM